MRITSKGQVTIPAEVREKLGLMPDTEVEFIVQGDAVRLVKKRTRAQRRGGTVISKLRGTATVKMSTDEIMSLTRKRR